MISKIQTYQFTFFMRFTSECINFYDYVILKGRVIPNVHQNFITCFCVTLEKIASNARKDRKTKIIINK